MFKKCSVVMLPTEKAEGFACFGDTQIWLFSKKDLNQNWQFQHNWQHLYILSDDKIEEREICWVLNTTNNSIFLNNPENGKIAPPKINILHKEYNKEHFKKIIATTDTSLTTNSSDTKYKYLHYLPQPSQGFINVFIEEYNKGNVITEVMVQYIKGEYVDGIVDCGADDLWDSGYYKSDILKVDTKDNTIHIKKLKDSWSREEHIKSLKTAIYQAISYPETFVIGICCDDTKIDKWIEENL